MIKRGAAYLLAAYLFIVPVRGAAQEPSPTVRFSSGLELTVVTDPALVGSAEQCARYNEQRRVKGVTLPAECEFYDPNHSGNPLLAVRKDDLDQKLSPHITVGDYAKIGERKQMKYAREDSTFKRGKEYFSQYIRIDPGLLDRLEQLHQQTRLRLPIIDGYRSFGYNTRMYWSLGKTPTSSWHSSGKAVDIRVRPKKVSLLVQRLFENDGIGFGGSFVHLDTRGSKARWYYHFGKKKKRS